MKKTLIKIGLILGSVIALTNCAKEPETQQEPEQIKGEEFKLYASAPETKTTNEGLDTKWLKNDKLTVFYGEAGVNKYSAGLVFNCDVAATGHFTGNLDANHQLAASNDWYAFYSSAINYNGELQAAFTTPKKSSWIAFGARTDYKTPQVQEQTGINTTAHIAGNKYPLYGEALGVASTTSPSIKMSHLSSLIKIDVTNNSGDILNVPDIEVETPATTPIVGLFTYEVITDKVSLTPVAGNGTSGNPNCSNIARLEVKGAEIEAGTTASFYIGTAPFVLNGNEKLMVRVNGYQKTLTINANAKLAFKSGKIKALPFNFDKIAAPEPTFEGEYVIAVKEGNDYIAMLAEDKTNDNRLDFATMKGYTAGNYEAPAQQYLWTLTKISPWIYTFSAKKSETETVYLKAVKNQALLDTKAVNIKMMRSKTPNGYNLSFDLGNTDGIRML